MCVPYSEENGIEIARDAITVQLKMDADVLFPLGPHIL